MRPDPSARELVPDLIERAELGGVSPMTIATRRSASRDIIRWRKYRLRHELEAFKMRSIAATASGGAATTAPNPHRRLAKKPQPAGGTVT
jgi:hypothetical protein